MQLNGILLVLEPCVDNFNLCQIGLYGEDEPCILKCKFWNTSIPEGLLIQYFGLLQKDSDGLLYLDIKFYLKLPLEYPEGGFQLSSIFTGHGIYYEGHLECASWNTTFKVRQDFNVNCLQHRGDPRCPPSSSTRLFVAGKVVGFRDNILEIVMDVMDYCRKPLTEPSPTKGKGKSPAKSFKVLPTIKLPGSIQPTFNLNGSSPSNSAQDAVNDNPVTRANSAKEKSSKKRVVQTLEE